jgi:hypothetical protein
MLGRKPNFEEFMALKKVFFPAYREMVVVDELKMLIGGVAKDKEAEIAARIATLSEEIVTRENTIDEMKKNLRKRVEVKPDCLSELDEAASMASEIHTLGKELEAAKAELEKLKAANDIDAAADDPQRLLQVAWAVSSVLQQKNNDFVEAIKSAKRKLTSFDIGAPSTWRSSPLLPEDLRNLSRITNRLLIKCNEGGIHSRRALCAIVPNGDIMYGGIAIDNVSGEITTSTTTAQQRFPNDYSEGDYARIEKMEPAAKVKALEKQMEAMKFFMAIFTLCEKEKFGPPILLYSRDRHVRPMTYDEVDYDILIKRLEFNIEKLEEKLRMELAKLPEDPPAAGASPSSPAPPEEHGSVICPDD